jgi:hypothetical protein
MHKMGFVPSPADPCLFTMNAVTIAIWIDDILACGPDEKDLDWVYEILSKQFKTKDLEAPAYFLGIEITRDLERNEITLSQHTYLAKVIERFDKSNVKNREMFINPSAILTKYEGQVTKQAVRKYASEIGSINWAFTATRPDICYAASILSRFLSNPGPEHFTALEWL